MRSVRNSLRSLLGNAGNILGVAHCEKMPFRQNEKEKYQRGLGDNLSGKRMLAMGVDVRSLSRSSMGGERVRSADMFRNVDTLS